MTEKCRMLVIAVCTHRARPGLEIDLVRWAGSKMNVPDWARPKRLGPYCQQLATNNYIPKYKSKWNVMALYGSNTSSAENVREPATSTRLTVNCHPRSRSIGYVC